MNDAMERGYVSAARAGMANERDSRAIQAAVDEAARLGVNRVAIPRVNPRTGEPLWVIDEAILLPSGMTVLLQDCHLVMADGVMDNMFANSLAYDEALGCTPEGAQRDISILGSGCAVLDGGAHNGLLERTSQKDGRPHIMKNLTIYMHNVERFRVENLAVVNSRWWALCFMYCREGTLRDLRFDSPATVRNQDGIDLRVGCHNVLIENVTGVTGDDTIALTALSSPVFEQKYAVEGMSTDIHHVVIRNVMASSCGCSLIRLLNHDGHKLHHITIENVIDTNKKQANTGVLIGDTGYFRTRMAARGETSDIYIHNLQTAAHTALLMKATVSDSTFRDISTFGDARTAIGAVGCDLANVFIDGVRHRPETDEKRALMRLCDCAGENVVVEHADETYDAHVTGSLAVSYNGRTLSAENTSPCDKSEMDNGAYFLYIARG